jgi:serine/threonine-protein kinase
VFLSMELVRGEDLGALLRRADRLPLERAVEVGCQVCDGLAAAHTQGVLHRDLKPANILVDDGGRVRITDFGIAVALGAGAAGGPAGTPGYMAPEQAAGSASLDTTCDMWAFGAVMFELLSGTPAFPRSTEFARRGEQADPAVQWVRLPSGTPRPLRALLEHCLVADPTRRLADASQARRVLDSLRPEAGSDSRTPRETPLALAS